MFPASRPRHRSRIALLAAFTAAALATVSLAPSPAHAIVPPASYQVTSRVSVSSAGVAGSSAFSPRITPDGRYVVFAMTSPSQFPKAGPLTQVFRRDLWSNTTVLVSTAANLAEVPNGSSDDPAISDDGRFVAFDSLAENLVSPDSNFHRDVFMRDMDTGFMRLLSRNTAGTKGDGDSRNPSISGIGDKVAFESVATNLTSLDANGASDIFVRNWINNTTSRVSVSGTSVGGDGASTGPAMSGDGSWVSFTSASTNLVFNDTNKKSDIFLRNLAALSTSRVSGTLFAEGDGHSTQSAIDNDGKHVVFASLAKNLVSGDSNGASDTFRWTRTTGAIQRVSVNAFGLQIAKGSYFGSAISRDGNVVAWTSQDADVTIPAGNGVLPNVYTRDIAKSSTRLISADPLGQTSNDLTFQISLDQTGRRVAYDSGADTLVRHDTNGDWDAFVTDVNVSVAPFTDLAGFVTQQYKDFVGRVPTTPERNEGMAQILNGELSPSLYIVARSHAAPWSGGRASVLRLYWAFFKRAPDQGGFQFWVDKVKSGSSLDVVAQAFAQSPEFKTKYGPLDDTAFVKLVYVNVLNRAADANGTAHWVDQLQHHGLKRGSMMIGFSESAEGRRVIEPVTDTVLIYLAMIRTFPTKAFFDQWRTTLGPAKPASVLVDTLRTSGAYLSRFP
ncbi:MAG: hypothetical protein JWM05_2650 [Acidimicrobiales bacterium]|nr:hypothetical protein [Acidimicrobiales bacterium]